MLFGQFWLTFHLFRRDFVNLRRIIVTLILRWTKLLFFYFLLLYCFFSFFSLSLIWLQKRHQIIDNTTVFILTNLLSDNFLLTFLLDSSFFLGSLWLFAFLISCCIYFCLFLRLGLFYWFEIIVRIRLSWENHVLSIKAIK